MNFFGLDTADFMPHGHCVLWQESILFPMVGSDIIIFLSYSAIPFSLYYFYSHREGITPEVKKLLLLFVLFIQLCGFSHLITAYNYWHAEYHWELLIKVATALISAATAIIIIKNTKGLLSIPSPAEFQEANRRLKELNENLEQEVQKQTQEILHEKAALEAIYQSINEGIFEINPIRNDQGNIIDFKGRPLNTKAMEHTGLSEPELTIESFNKERPTYRENGRFEAYCHVLKTGIPKIFDPSDYVINNRIYRAVYTKSGPNSILLFLSNITERESLKTQAMVNSRLSALGELAGGVAHEINSPLQIISGAARQIERKIKNDDCANPDNIENLELIQGTVKNISKIIKNLKRLSHKTSEEHKQFAVIPFLENIKDFVKVSVKNAGISLEEDFLDRENFYLNASEVALSQIIVNLINNAVDELSTINNRERVLRIDIHSDDNQKTISINDNGNGISQENLDKIFTPLFTTKDVGKGTGLGLSLSSKLAQSMDAYIDVDQNKGTTFKIIFPTKGNK